MTEGFSSSEGYLKQAEAARQKQAWDEAIKVYQIALRQLPDDLPLHLALAQAYEAKARQTNIKALSEMAIQEFWRVVRADPTQTKAVDGLLAAAYNAGRLSEVMEEFRGLMAAHPEVEAFKMAFKKIETLFLFSAAPPPVGGSGGPLQTAMERGAPLAALVSLLGWVVVRMKGGPTGESLSPLMRGLQELFLKFGVFSAVAYLGYLGFTRLRKTQ